VPILKAWFLAVAICAGASFTWGIYAGHEDQLKNLEGDILGHCDIRKVDGDTCITYLAPSKHLGFDYHVDSGEVFFLESSMAADDKVISFPLTKDFVMQAVGVAGALSVADLGKEILKGGERQDSGNRLLFVAVSTVSGFMLGFELGKHIETSDERNRIRAFFSNPDMVTKLRRDFFLGSFLAREAALTDKLRLEAEISALIENSRTEGSEEKKKFLSQMQSRDATALDASKHLKQSKTKAGFVPTNQDFQLLLTMMNQA
jgi:uncharacterized protein YdaU (DUF1376 family)